MVPIEYFRDRPRIDLGPWDTTSIANISLDVEAFIQEYAENSRHPFRQYTIVAPQYRDTPFEYLPEINIPRRFPLRYDRRMQTVKLQPIPHHTALYYRNIAAKECNNTLIRQQLSLSSYLDLSSLDVAVIYNSHYLDCTGTNVYFDASDMYTLQEVQLLQQYHRRDNPYLYSLNQPTTTSLVERAVSCKHIRHNAIKQIRQTLHRMNCLAMFIHQAH